MSGNCNCYAPMPGGCSACRPFSHFRDAAEQIVVDLTTRRGLRQAWEEVEPDIQSEIIDEWTRIIKLAVSEAK